MAHTKTLPTHLRHLYRLSLRASSASVLYHPGASKNLRRLYRTVFDAAATLCLSTEWLEAFDSHGTSNHRSGQESVQFDSVFTHTVNSTLAFLYSSAVSRGSAHKYTRNRAFLLHAQNISTRQKRNNARSWDSKRPQDAEKRAQNLRFKMAKERSSGSRMADIEQNIQSNWALRQTQMMAEGMGSIILGRNTQ